MSLPSAIAIVQGFVDAVNHHEMDEIHNMLDDDATLSSC